MLEQQGLHEELQKKRRKKEHEILTELLENFIYNTVSSLALSLLFFAHKLDNVSQKLKSFLEESPIESNN
jgi:hypothetical protein